MCKNNNKPKCEDGRNKKCYTWCIGYCEECVDNEDKFKPRDDE